MVLCGSGSVVIKGGAIEDSLPKQETFRRQGWTVDMHCCALLLCKNAYIDSELVQKYTSLFQYICCITRTFSTLVQKHKLCYFFTCIPLVYIYMDLSSFRRRHLRDHGGHGLGQLLIKCLTLSMKRLL